MFIMSEKIIACASFIVFYKLLKRQKRKRLQRRWWNITLFKNPVSHGGNNLLNDVETEDSGKFKNFCRMSLTDFNTLLDLIDIKIMKSDTNYRKAISPRERLAITLRVLAIFVLLY